MARRRREPSTMTVTQETGITERTEDFLQEDRQDFGEFVERGQAAPPTVDEATAGQENRHPGTMIERPPVAAGVLQEIELHLLAEHPANPRKRFDPERTGIGCPSRSGKSRRPRTSSRSSGGRKPPGRS